MLTLLVRHEVFTLRERFNISRGEKHTADVVVAEVTQDGLTGRGECVPYARYGKTIADVVETLRNVPLNYSSASQARIEIQERMPAGPARNALDCALWELSARQLGCSVRSLCERTFSTGRLSVTISLDTPRRMARQAKAAHPLAVLKLKLGHAAGDLDRVRAVRQVCPSQTLIVDVNEGWTPSEYLHLAPVLTELNVEWIEQPLAETEDEQLATLPRPIKVCADESVHARDSLARLLNLYDGVNIKLDKTGGLTEAMLMVDEVKAHGMSLMLGCMVSSSLSIAPAMVLCEDADLLDLDGSLLLGDDREGGVSVDDDAHLALPTCWGP